MKKPLLLLAVSAICSACNLSTDAPAGTGSGPRTVDSTGYPYAVLAIQGHFLPYSYILGVTHTIISANLCLFKNGTYRFAEVEETPSNLSPDALYETYDTYSLSGGKVSFAGQGPGTSTIGTDTISYVNARINRTYLFYPNAAQLNQSCVNPATTP